MEEACKIEAGGFRSEFSTARLGQGLRRIIPCIPYAATYALILCALKLSGFSPLLGNFSMTAGLNVALLLVYGIWYSPVIFLATALEGLWYAPLPYSTPLALMQCVSVALLETGIAWVLRRFGEDSGATLKRTREMAGFILSGTLGSAVLGLAASLHSLPAVGGWSPFFVDFRTHWAAFAAGILCVIPILIMYGAPWIESVLFGIDSNRHFAEWFHLPAIRKGGTIVAMSFAGLAAVVVSLIVWLGISDRLYVLLLLSIPLIWIALRHGLGGLSAAVPALLCISAAALRIGGAAESMRVLLPVLLIGSINAYMVAFGMSKTRETDTQLKRQDAILDAVNCAAQQLSGSGGWDAGVQELMTRMGEASAVTRVYLLDNRKANPAGQVGDASLYEWTSPSAAAGSIDRQALNILRTQMIDELAGKLSMGQPHVYRTKDIDRKKQKALSSMNIRSGVIIPIFVERQWWGCLGLEQCFADRDWLDGEIDGLNVAGRVLGTLIASVRVERQFRHLSGNIDAVFWISGPDGRTRQYVSPGYEKIWGRSCISLLKDQGSWLQAVHPEDQARVCEAVAKQPSGEYDEKYRLEHTDGSVRWIHDRAFPVRDEMGKVRGIVGIAEDITLQKETEDQLRTVAVMLSSLMNHLHSGIMVEDDMRRITQVNESFIDTFRVLMPSEPLIGVDSRKLFAQGAGFAERIEQTIKAGLPVLDEELNWQGRVFLRNYVPLSIDGSNRYHFWQYRDVTESRLAEQQIKASLKEKEVLLKEVHHRVKNNLQIISSLLNLQSMEIEDPRATQKFAESQDRVKAMALIHERLYQSGDLAKIDFATYVRSLTGHLARSYKVNAAVIRLNLEIDSVSMNLDVAIPCGLMINELVSNAFKYAFPDGKEGDIKVCLSQEEDGMLRLVVSDSGIGIPENVNPEESNSLGLKLVRTLTEQIGGSIRYRSSNGFLCEIRIPQIKT